MTIEVRRNDEAGAYEIHVDGVKAGLTEFRDRDGVMVMPHTEVDDAFAGQGLAGKLVAGALDDMRARGERIKPVCPYVAKFVEKHPEYADLVA